MLILKAYKFEIMPNGEQQRDMRSFVGLARKVWNLALAKQEADYAARYKYQGYEAMTPRLLDWKKAFPYLTDAPSQVLQQVMKNLHLGYKEFFKGTMDHPTFKKKGKCNESFRFPQGFKVDEQNKRLCLPKLGWIHYRTGKGKDRLSILGVAKNITISHKNGKWYASVQTEIEVEQPVPTATSAVGIDMGVVRFATLSDGTVYEPINAFKSHQKRLARYQRAVSRKKKVSKNWTKANAKVNKQHQRIGNIRRDYLHKISTIISNSHALVVIEDLKVRNMSKSAKGIIENPGRKVKQKSGLNRVILDQDWGEFRRQLEYKLAWNGGTLLAVPPHYTSQKCPCCRHTAAENRKTQAQFVCVGCGFEANADDVGSINILAAGHAVLAHGESVQLDGSVKWEPAEGSLLRKAA